MGRSRVWSGGEGGRGKMIQNGFGIALWVKLSSQYLGLIHVSTC